MLTQTRYILNFLLLITVSYAGELYPFDNQTRQTEFYSMVKDIRCLVCQNESILDSNAKLALDIRLLIYNKMQHGESKSQILAFLHQRYGNFIDYNPTQPGFAFWALWVSPVLILALAYLLFRIVKKGRI